MRSYNTKLTQCRLQEVLDYNPETGEFLCKGPTRGGVIAGTLAGCLCGDGYRRISIDNQVYLAHRLALLYMIGEWPDKDIDHINGSRSDNRICNLREATGSQNMQNNNKAHGRSKYRGVWWHKRGGKWEAAIKIDGKSVYIGLFLTEELAAKAYQQAQIEFHPFATKP